MIFIYLYGAKRWIYRVKRLLSVVFNYLHMVFN